MAAPEAVITGWGSYAPPRVLSKKDLESMIDTTDAWIMERTGIRERHVVDDGEATSSMAAKAARVAAETISRFIDWNDRSTCVLFGDGAVAVVIEASEGRGGIRRTVLRGDGTKRSAERARDRAARPLHRHREHGRAARVAGVEVVYNDVIVGLRGVSHDVPDGAIVALLGRDGAGKTACLSQQASDPS